MTEILTESFCERCGTRYTFESARPRVRLKGVKVLSRGLKNFVLSDETTMDEAMASARNETDREQTVHQLDAFHKTFNFCMSCRQYTCPNCWNGVEARCLTCAPHLGHEILPAPFPDLTDGANGTHAADLSTSTPVDVWGIAIAAPAPIEAETTDDDIDALAGLKILTGVEASVEAGSADETEPVLAADVAVEAESPVEAVADVSADPEADAESVARLAAFGASPPVADATTPADSNLRMAIGDKTAAQTGGLLGRFRPGQNIDDELDAYEREHSVAAEPEIVAEPEAVAAEPEAVAAEPQAVAAEPEILVAAEPDVLPEPEPVPEPTVPEDIVSQPTWRMVAPDPTPFAPTAPDASMPASATSVDPNSEPQWPARPAWREGTPSAGLPFLDRPATPEGGIEALWAESAREVVTAPVASGKPAVGGIQACVSCGLSLSANARFCRRCGTLQGG